MPRTEPRLLRRIERIDWERAGRDLDEHGHTRMAGLLTAAQCRGLEALFDDEPRFRKHVDMARHRFGEGEYRYFASPLPPLVATLRTALYPPLARIANRWMERLGEDLRYPRSLRGYLARCHAGGQKRPTPLLLRYSRGGYNNLHQDVYGPLAFPLQVTVLLTPPDQFAGGEFLLVEQQPRQQSRGEAIRLRQGEAIVFPNAVRPVRGARGWFRARARHGVSRLHSGSRATLGVIFHDAR